MSGAGSKSQEVCDELLGRDKRQSAFNAAVWIACAAGVQYDHTLSAHTADILSGVFTFSGLTTLTAGFIRQFRSQRQYLAEADNQQLQAES